MEEEGLGFLEALIKSVEDEMAYTNNAINRIKEVFKTSKFEEHEPLCLVTVDGLIGSGKSTFLDDLVSFNPDLFYVAPEPVAEWQEALEAFYAAGEDKTQVAFNLQNTILDCLEKRLIRVLSDPQIAGKIVVIERDAGSCKIFIKCTKNLFSREQLDVIEKKIIFQQAILKSLPITCAHFHAFLDGSAELSLARIKERARPGEEHITLEYLLRLQEQQQKAFQSYQIKVFEGEGAYQEKGFDRVKGIIKAFPIPSDTGHGAFSGSMRKRRVKRFGKHVAFIMLLRCLTKQLRQFQ